MLEPVFESALAHREEPTNTYVSLQEISTRGMIDLRGLASDKKFMAAAKSALGLELPNDARESVAFGDIKALWLSPDQWLILCNRDNAPALTAKLSGRTDRHSFAGRQCVGHALHHPRRGRRGARSDDEELAVAGFHRCRVHAGLRAPRALRRDCRAASTSSKRM